MSRKIDRIETWTDIFPQEVKRIAEMPPPEDGKKIILITGTGRSGTSWIAKVMQELGLDFKHEGAGVHGQASYKLAPWFEKLSKEQPERFVLVSLLRDRDQTVKSIIRQGYFHPNRFLYKAFAKIDPSINKVEKYYHRVAQYYYTWYGLCMPYSDYSYYLDTLTAHDLTGILYTAGHNNIPFERVKAAMSLKTLSKNSNKNKEHKFDYDEVFETN